MSGEVHGFVVDGLLRGLGRHGLDRAALLAGLAVRSDDVRYPYGWCDWSDVAALLARAQDALGGAWALERAFGALVETDPTMTVLACAVAGPRALYSEFLPRIALRIYRCAGLSILSTPDKDKVLVRARLFRGCEPCTAFWVATLGSLRFLPRLIGYEPAQVEADIAPDRADYLVTLPRARTVVDRMSRALAGASSRGWAQEGEAWTAVRDAIDINLIDLGLRTQVDEEGRALAACETAGELFERIAAFLREHFCCDYLTLWAKPGAKADFALVATRGSWDGRVGAVTTRELVSEGTVVGRIQAGLAIPADEGVAACLDTLLSWVAIGLIHCQHPATTQRVSPKKPDLPEKLGLTRRQREVMELLARGLSNKDIANALDCNVKTVETHVARILRSAGVRNRASLLRRLALEP
jgi:DNA-binding CsgD family transcriptional regulator